MIGWIKRLFTRSSDTKPEFGYSTSFHGLMSTWREAELEIVELTFGSNPVEDDCDFEDADDEESWLEHNPMDVAFPGVTARFRFPDLLHNDLLIYSENSRSYIVIKRREHPAETANLVEKLRAGWLYSEAAGGH